MANYSLKQGYEIIEEAGYGSEELKAFVKAYPNTAILLRGLNPVGGLRILLEAIPEHVTCSRVEKALCGNTTTSESESEIEEESKDVQTVPESKDAEKPEEPKEKAKPAARADGLKNKDIFEFLKSRKELRKCKDEFGDTKVASFTAYFAKYYPNGMEGARAEEESKPVVEGSKGLKGEIEIEARAEEAKDYDAMTPLQLFNECKKQGIKAKIKQPKEYYLELLMPKKEESKEAEDDDEWEVEEPKAEAKVADELKGGPEDFVGDELPEEPAKKPAKKKAAAPAKEAETEDDEWDI